MIAIDSELEILYSLLPVKHILFCQLLHRLSAIDSELAIYILFASEAYSLLPVISSYNCYWQWTGNITFSFASEVYSLFQWFQRIIAIDSELTVVYSLLPVKHILFCQWFHRILAIDSELTVVYFLLPVKYILFCQWSIFSFASDFIVYWLWTANLQ